VQKKWKYFRGYFHVENVKIPQSQSEDVSTNVTPLLLNYKQLLFLKDYIRNRMSHGNLQTGQPGNKTTDSCSEPCVDNKTLQDICVARAWATCFSITKGLQSAQCVTWRSTVEHRATETWLLKQKHARQLQEFDNEDVNFFPRVSCLMLSKFRQTEDCFSGTRFKRQHLVQDFHHCMLSKLSHSGNASSPRWYQ
jgi:hypothetical protein